MKETIPPRKDRNTSTGRRQVHRHQVPGLQEAEDEQEGEGPGNPHEHDHDAKRQKNENDEDHDDEDSVEQGHHERPPSPGRSGHGIRLPKNGRAGFLRLGRRKQGGSGANPGAPEQRKRPMQTKLEDEKTAPPGTGTGVPERKELVPGYGESPSGTADEDTLVLLV